MTKKLGIQKIISLILEAELQQSLQNETLFQSFLDLLRSYDYLTVEEQQEYLMDYIKHNSLLTPTELKAKFLPSTNNDQSPISFENPLFKKIDTENFSFTEQKKVSALSQTNLNSYTNSPNFTNFELLQKNLNEKKSNPVDLSMKRKEMSYEKMALNPIDTQINKNPKSSNVSHKSEEIFPSFYSGKLFEPSAKDHYIDVQLENEKIGNDFKYNSLNVPIKKSWSEKFPKKSSFLEENFDNLDERRESQSYQ